jgi:hypothetical protein
LRSSGMITHEAKVESPDDVHGCFKIVAPLYS